ncbi:hypothetical protein BpHYR1_025519 [Brachionus plicatilis]|uniref:Uncharacterized protein n=1 Tax=Brachionus plicatilis TaxID=10195 RepID=A0A3M7RBJ9_BRAPC|nr:hypothetical protein BpHYR1_025519 [Brachionus plicatilis]
MRQIVIVTVDHLAKIFAHKLILRTLPKVFGQLVHLLFENILLFLAHAPSFVFLQLSLVAHLGLADVHYDQPDKYIRKYEVAYENKKYGKYSGSGEAINVFLNLWPLIATDVAKQSPHAIFQRRPFFPRKK